MFGIEVDQYRPPFGDLLTVALVGAAAAALLWLYVFRESGASRFRRAVMIAFRMVAIAAVAWVLFGPSSQWGEQVVRHRLPVLIFADASASMDRADVANPQPTPGESADEPITRWRALTQTWLDRQYHADLAQVADVKLFAFDQDVRRISVEEAQTLTPQGKATLMYDSLQQGVDAAQRGEDLLSVDSAGGGLALLLTDAHDTQRSADMGLGLRLKQQGWRVFGVPVGSVQSVRDVSLIAWTDADFLLDDQATWINAAVTQTGFDHRQVQVDLSHEGRLVETRTLSFDQTPTQQVRFHIKPPERAKPGQRIEGYRLSAKLLPLPGAVDDGQSEETLLNNNQRWVFVQVSGQRIRVAMFEAQPYWDTKFLARMVREDPQIELTSVYNLASGRTVTVQSNVRAGSAGENTTEKDFDPLWLTQARLNEFDVVILGKGAQHFFGGHRAQWLVDYVEQRGGSLVLARGKAFDDHQSVGREAEAIVSRITPVDWGRGAYHDLKLKLTQQGRSSPLLGLSLLDQQDALLTRLPDMIAATRVQREKAMSIVLLRQSTSQAGESQAPEMAAVAYRNAGQGRVLAVLTDGLWRWAFLPSAMQEYDNVYHGFWARTLRWLATGGQFLPGQSMSLGLSRLQAAPGETVEIAVTTRYVEQDSFEPKLTIVAPDGSTQPIKLTRAASSSTRYLGALKPTQPGVYEVLLTAEGAVDTPENGAQAPEPMALRGRLAVYEQSQELRDPSARPELLKQLCEATGGRCLSLQERDIVPQMLNEIWRAREKDQKMSYIFNQPIIFTIIAAMFALEWIIRRRGGLL